MKVGILGAGVVGLTVARLLSEKGHEIEILEAQDKIGGLCRSEIGDGFVYDIGGGHIIYSKDEDIQSFMLSILGEQNVVRNVRNTKIFYKGHYVKYPFENGLCDLPTEDNYECLMGYIMADFARKNGRRGAPKNFREWIPYRFGEGIAERFMYPYNEKIWNVDLSLMSTDWVKDRVPNAPLEDIIRASLGISTEGYKHQSVFYYPLKRGIQLLCDKLVIKFKDCIRLDTPVTHIRKKKNSWIVNGKEYDQVISTVPVQELLRVLENVDKEAEIAADNLMFTSLATFLIGLNEPNVSPYSWVYLPHKDNGPCNRITYLSNYSPHNAPDGKNSILAEVTYLGGTDLEINNDYVNLVVSSLHRNGMLDKRTVCFTDWKKTEYAYVVYDLHHDRKTRVISDYLDSIGLHCLGRFAKFSYTNMDQVIKEAMELVKKKF